MEPTPTVLFKFSYNLDTARSIQDFSSETDVGAAFCAQTNKPTQEPTGRFGCLPSPWPDLRAACPMYP